MRCLTPVRLLTLVPTLFCASAAFALEPTCATFENPTCGLPGILHWLRIIAFALAVIFLVLLGLVIRYYVHIRNVPLKTPEEVEDLND